MQRYPSVEHGTQSETIPQSSLDHILHSLNRVEYMITHAPHRIRLDSESLRDLEYARDEVSGRVEEEIDCYQEMIEQERLVQQYRDMQRELSEGNSRDYVQALERELRAVQRDLEESRDDYDSTVEENTYFYEHLHNMVQLVTHNLYEAGIISLETYVGLEAEQNNQPINSETLLPTYEQVKHAKIIERRAYRRAEMTPDLRPTHASPPPYEEAVMTPPSYTENE